MLNPSCLGWLFSLDGWNIWSSRDEILQSFFKKQFIFWSFSSLLHHKPWDSFWKTLLYLQKLTFFRHYIVCCPTVSNSACLCATQTFLCKLHSWTQQITTAIFHIIRLQGDWGLVLADELHCCVWWQFGQQRERGGRIVCSGFCLCLRFKLDPQLHRQGPAESWTWAEPWQVLH